MVWHHPANSFIVKPFYLLIMILEEINKIALSEGWAIFDCGGTFTGDGYRIERIDEDNKFENDVDVIKYVFNKSLTVGGVYKEALNFAIANANETELKFLLTAIND